MNSGDGIERISSKYNALLKEVDDVHKEKIPKAFRGLTQDAVDTAKGRLTDFFKLCTDEYCKIVRENRELKERMANLKKIKQEQIYILDNKNSDKDKQIEDLRVEIDVYKQKEEELSEKNFLLKRELDLLKQNIKMQNGNNNIEYSSNIKNNSNETNNRGNFFTSLWKDFKEWYNNTSFNCCKGINNKEPEINGGSIFIKTDNNKILYI